MARVWAVAGCDGEVGFRDGATDGDGEGEGETSGDGAVAGGVAGGGATDSTVTGDSVAAEAFCD